MGMSDNAKWLILAVASSVFIGTSFILKKKGPKQAGSTGTRAGLSFFFFFFFFLFIQLGILKFVSDRYGIFVWRRNR